MMARFAAIVRVGPPLEDIYSVFAWLHGNAGQLGLDPARIGIKGESGGGGFAVSSDAIDAQRSGDFFNRHSTSYGGGAVPSVRISAHSKRSVVSQGVV